MKILVCQDSYKGTMTAQTVVSVIKSGLERELGSDSQVSCFPLADGGEGSSKIIIEHLGGSIYTAPLDPNYSFSEIGEVGIVGKDAYIDVASASGLPDNPTLESFLESSSYGTGELIRFAIKKGCHKIHLCLGGSGVNDGGIGALAVFGVRFLDKNKNQLDPRTKNLNKIREIDFSKVNKNKMKFKFVFLTDVQNPLIGSTGATYVFSKQKGASEGALQMVEKGMNNLINVYQRYGFDSKHDLLGVGAAGGLSYSLTTFFCGEYCSGFDFIFKVTGLKEELSKADILIVGEGKYDYQTSMGKIVEGVLNQSQKFNMLRILLAGAIQWNYDSFQNTLIDFVQSTVTENQTITQIREHAESNLYNASRNLGKIITNIKLKSR